MTPAEIQNLSTALVNHRGECVCGNCAPWVGVSSCPRQDFSAAPLLTIDPAMPVLGVCPECSAKYQVPATTAIALMCSTSRPFRATAEQSRNPILVACEKMGFSEAETIAHLSGDTVPGMGRVRLLRAAEDKQ